MTSGSANVMADKLATTEVAKALAPICFLQFNQQAGAEAKLVELKAITSPYQQAAYIEKNGAAVMPGSDKVVAGVSLACAKLLLQAAAN